MPTIAPHSPAPAPRTFAEQYAFALAVMARQASISSETKAGQQDKRWKLIGASK